MTRFQRASLAPAAAVLAAALAAGCRATGPERITIERDEYGVPSIFADTEEGAAFGAGYAQSEDRLEEILRQYRRATGTMSEAFGPDYFRDDYRQRLWRHASVSRERYGEVSPRARRVVEAYIDGVKLFMLRHPEKVPAWAPAVEPWMVIALGRHVIWGWPEGTAGEDLERAGIHPDPVEPRASNEWVVSGARTACGAPIALVDPHLSWYDAFRFYEARLYGGALEVAGAGIVGSPVPSLGHNRYLSVAMTTGGPDTSDVYEITLDAAHPGKYLYDGEWLDLQVRNEVIRVKKGDRTEDVPVTIESTLHGPIVAHRDGKGYAVKIPYAEEVGLVDQTLELMTARDLASAKKALSRLQLMEQNVMIATVDGDIYYVRNGRVPVRPEGVDPSRPIPGYTSKTLWLGIHPFGDLVQVENPPQGYMQNCNVTPAVMMEGSALVKERWAERPYLFNEERPFLHQRAAEARAELAAEARLTEERAIEIAHSTVVFGADRWQQMLRAAAGGVGAGLGEDARRVLDLVTGWDRRADPASAGAAAYFYWKSAVYEAPDELPPESAVAGERRVGRAARLLDQAGLEPPAVPPERLTRALETAASKLKEHWGSVEVPYGRVFRCGRKGSPRDFPVGGGNQAGMSTPRSVHYRLDRDGKTYHGAGGQTATQVVVLTRPPRSYSLNPLGESDDPASPHFDDQAEKLMSPARLKPTRFLERGGPHVRSTLTLERRRDEP